MAAARAQQLVSKAQAALAPAYRSARSQVVTRYESILAKNQQYVVKDKDAADKLLKQYTFTQMARIPEGIATCKTEAAAWREKLSHFRELPVPEMATYVGFGAEVFAWFCVGEIVGRGFTFGGYAI